MKELLDKIKAIFPFLSFTWRIVVILVTLIQHGQVKKITGYKDN